MKLLFLCPQWGYEHLPLEALVSRVKEAGYDGIDTWVPPSPLNRQHLMRLLDAYGLVMVSHQHQAVGSSIRSFCRSFSDHLKQSLETEPLFITSHSGRDYFTLDDQLRLIDTAAEFSETHTIRVVHETHRGRIGYSPASVRDLFARRPNYRLTADLSHWVCATESYLEGYGPELAEAIARADHIHARIGFPQGPQVPDPRLPDWQEPIPWFLGWWDAIVTAHHQRGTDVLTITPEFGPPPYMWRVAGRPVADQWTINLYIKDLLKSRYPQLR